MEIQYFGHSCFRIKSKQAIIVINPIVKTSADIVIISQKNNEDIKHLLVQGTSQRSEPFVIDVPGEYEISGISILSKKYGNSLVYIIDAEEMRLVYLGDVVQKLSEAQLEEINGVDILFVSGQAASLVYQIEPKIVIPNDGKSQDIFLKTMGVEKPDVLPKLIVKKDNLPEERQVVILGVRN